ncbi:MAG: hypothetical protein HKL95_08315 [Phycisphaerae bacterium]|nr:hypothetical protein [Phycisphaerae bacterium]
MRFVRVLARKIELLSPAVNDGGRQPANCEYPWLAGNGMVRAPCEHDFGINLIDEKAGRLLLKVLYIAANDLITP